MVGEVEKGTGAGGSDTPETEVDPNATEPNYEELYKAEKSAHGETTQKLQSADGRLQSQQASTEMLGLRSEVSNLTAGMREMRLNGVRSNPDLSPEEKTKQTDVINAESVQDAARNALIAHRGDLENSLTEFLSEASIPLSHDAVQEAMVQWGQANTAKGYNAIYTKLINSLVKEIKGQPNAETEELKQKLEDERKRENAINGTMEAGALSTGTGAAMSKQQWMDNYADEVNGNIPATPENAAKARALQAEGIIPRVRPLAPA